MNNIEERRLVNDAAISDLTEEERNNPTEAILTNFLNKDWPKLEQFLRDNLGGMSHIIFNVNAGFDKKENEEENPGHCLFAVIGKANPNALFPQRWPPLRLPPRVWLRWSRTAAKTTRF